MPPAVKEVREVSDEHHFTVDILFAAMLSEVRLVNSPIGAASSMALPEISSVEMLLSATIEEISLRLFPLISRYVRLGQAEKSFDASPLLRLQFVSVTRRRDGSEPKTSKSATFVSPFRTISVMPVIIFRSSNVVMRPSPPTELSNFLTLARSL